MDAELLSFLKSAFEIVLLPSVIWALKMLHSLDKSVSLIAQRMRSMEDEQVEISHKHEVLSEALAAMRDRVTRLEPPRAR